MTPNEICNGDLPMYGHSLPRILSVLSITRRKLGLPVSTVDDIILNKATDRPPSTEEKVMAQPRDVGWGKDQPGHAVG